MKPSRRHPTSLILKTAIPNDLLPGVPRRKIWRMGETSSWSLENRLLHCSEAVPRRRLIVTIMTSLSQSTCIAQSAGREFGSFSWVATAHLRYPTVEDAWVMSGLGGYMASASLMILGLTCP